MSNTLASLRPPQLRSAKEWPNDVQELAFELWYTTAGRNCSTLASVLAADPYNHPIPYSTLTYWSRTRLWDIEADKRADAFAPNRRARTTSHLDVAAEHGASYLAQVNSGAVPPDKLRILAAKVSLDSAGFAPARTTADHPTALPPSARDLRTLTDQELASLEHGHHID